ncbi:AAA family ATPase [Shewanella sp. SR44-4]|nr:AAA family ATPase [Shewanella sp. SR44-4]
MKNGGMIRIGRKELRLKSAKEVFATFEPRLNTIKCEQRFLNRPDYLCTDVNSHLSNSISLSDDLVAFSTEHPIDRKPYWPSSYGDIDDGQELISLETQVKEPKGIYQMQTSPLNQIFYGPPGTGKTYHTIEAAVKAAEPKFKWHNRDELKTEYDRLVAAKRIRFVTFHQSYGYEEFVEGLKAKTTEDKSIEYVVENGAFKSIADDAKSTAFRKSFEVSSDATIWKISIDGTGKSEVSNHCLANSIAAIGWGSSGDLLSEELDDNEYYQKLGPQVKSSLSEFSQRASVGDLILCIGSQRTVQAVGVISGNYHFEPKGTSVYSSYCNQLPINWLVTDINIDFHALNGGVNFTQKTFYELWRFSVADVFELLNTHGVHINSKESEQNKTENYVLIIDEINRGNISKIFGELITLIEPSKRTGEGQKESLTLNLPYSGKPFSVPDNLYIIGTMNTADRSLALMDTALRRRFDFIEMMPNYDVFSEHGLLNVDGVQVDLAELLKTMNQRIEVLYDREHMLGHAFFIPVVELITAKNHSQALIELKNVFKNKVLPLLQEYFFEDWNRIRLVLGDSKKSKSDWLVQISEQSFNDIFGSDHGLGNFDTAPKTYQIASFDDHSIWDKPETYQAIYSVKKTPDTADETNTLESRED